MVEVDPFFKYRVLDVGEVGKGRVVATYNGMRSLFIGGFIACFAVALVAGFLLVLFVQAWLAGGLQVSPAVAVSGAACVIAFAMCMYGATRLLWEIRCSARLEASPEQVSLITITPFRKTKRTFRSVGEIAGFAIHRRSGILWCADVHIFDGNSTVALPLLRSHIEQRWLGLLEQLAVVGVRMVTRDLTTEHRRELGRGLGQ